MCIYVFQGSVEVMNVVIQGSVQVNDGHSYDMELISQDAITTLTVTRFLLKDYSVNNTMLQVLEHYMYIYYKIVAFAETELFVDWKITQTVTLIIILILIVYSLFK